MCGSALKMRRSGIKNQVAKKTDRERKRPSWCQTKAHCVVRDYYDVVSPSIVGHACALVPVTRADFLTCRHQHTAVLCRKLDIF